MTTTAKEADIKQFDHPTEKEKSYIFADSAYMSKEKKRKLRKQGIFNSIIERRVRGQSTLRPKHRMKKKET